MSSLLDEALILAEGGTAVLPLNDKKMPLIKGAVHNASTDPEVIRSWDWRNAKAIGGAIPAGQFVVDVDIRHDGHLTVETLKKAGLMFGATRIHKTGGGGQHRFYRLPEGLEDARLRGQLGPGIDILMSGKKHVVLPPSPGYTVAMKANVALAPQWMLDELVKEAAKTDTSVGSLPKFFDQWESGTSYGTAALERELGRLLSEPEGGRNNALNKSAFSLGQLVAGGELEEAKVLESLATAGERMGLDPEEIEQTVASGFEAGRSEPREAPRDQLNGNGPKDDIFIPPKKEFVDRTGDFPTPHEHDEDHIWLDWENADDTPPKFYLHPMIPKNAYVLVFGATEASKSMVMLGLACEGSHKGLRTSMYSLENPSHIDIDRVKRMGPDGRYFRISNEMLDLNDSQQVMNMIKREKEWSVGGVTDWLIIDTYSHAFNSRSEDGNAKAIEFARRIRYIMHEIGCTVIVLDHVGYADHGEPRDASAKRQQVDVALRMERTVAWAPGQSSKFLIENKKSARFGNPFLARGEIEDVKPGRGLKLRWNSGHEPRWDCEADSEQARP